MHSSIPSIYRTHTCGQLNESNINETVKLSGWLHSKRNHGGVIFADLRDHYGITQIVIDENKTSLTTEILDNISLESVITIEGKVVEREQNTFRDIPTGRIEIVVEKVTIQSIAEMLPFQVNDDSVSNDELRLKYRFLDLRRQKIHNHIVLRSQVIAWIRKYMISIGFTEFQTPILTASSPEGARDFLVPSRIHPGQFYALPQAPQQFKQLLMISGFDRYFQIAPCFRDEDARADRSPGEFYQLDIEMSFVTQEDVFKTIEPVIRGVFTTFSDKKIDAEAFPRITYKDSMLKYGNDKPDLRNPLINADVTEYFKDSEFKIFNQTIKNGGVARAIPVPKGSGQPRSYFDKMIEYAKSLEAPGLAYIIFETDGTATSPIAKFLSPDQLEGIKKAANLNNGDAVFFTCDAENKANKLAGFIRTKVGQTLNLIPNDCYKFCWVVDFPYIEWSEWHGEKRLDFAHNPFSMPMGGLEALQTNDTEELLKINAYQYDIVCNGVELSSGAIRNHQPEIMYRAFEIVGYTKAEVDAKFGGMIQAFKYGAPPHGGIAPGIDRIVMLLADTDNIRDIIAFPLNGKAQDLLMNAPSAVEEKQLRELHIKLR